MTVAPENQAVKGFAPVITPVVTLDDSWKNDDSSNDSQSKTSTNLWTETVSVTPDDSDDSSDSEIKVGSGGSHNNLMHVLLGDKGTIEGKRDLNSEWIVD